MQRVRYRDVVHETFLHDMRLRAPAERRRIWKFIDAISPLSESEKRQIQASYMRAWRRDQWHSSTFYRNISFGLLSVTYLGYASFVVIADHAGAGFWENYSGLANTALAITVLVTINCLVAMRRYERNNFAGPRARRSDLLLKFLIEITGQAHTVRQTWWDNRECRRVMFRIDFAARNMKLTRVRLRRTEVWTDRSFRAEIRLENRRIAEVLREHSRALSKAGNQAEYERILDSLRDGLTAAAIDDWDSLLENSPSITQSPIALRIFARLWPSGLLLGTAALLPMVPGFESSADDIRKFLTPMGVLAALGASETVTSSVRNVLDKVVWGSK